MPRRYLWPILGVLALLSVGALYYRAARSRQLHETIEQAIEAIEAQRLEEAVAFLLAALTQKPNDAQARYLLAQTYFLQRDLDAALSEFRQVPVDHPQAEMVQVQMAGIHLTLNRPGAAESVLRDCLVRFPQSVAARQYLLDVLGLQLREREMMAVLDELWQLAATRPVMDKVWILSKSLHVRFMRPNEEEVWPTLQAFARQEPDNLHTQVATAKLRLLMNADVLEAARTLEHCLERSPDNLEAIAALATHYVQHEAVAAERIEELLDRWRSVSQDAEYWQALGDWQVRTGDLDDALDSYRRARTHNPSQWHTPHKIGLLLIRLAKQSAETDPALIAEGQRLLDEAAALKEMRASASKHFEFLQKWLRDSAETSRIVSAPLPLPELAEIATFCESVQSYTDALRWCDLIQRADPSETTSATIRQRVTVQMEAARGPG